MRKGEGGREEGKEGGREEGREEGREGGKREGREGGRESGREGGTLYMDVHFISTSCLSSLLSSSWHHQPTQRGACLLTCQTVSVQIP